MRHSRILIASVVLGQILAGGGAGLLQAAPVSGYWVHPAALDIDSWAQNSGANTVNSVATNNVERIIDTPDYTYFMISGILYNANLLLNGNCDEEDYFYPRYYPAILDKSKGADARVETLSSLMELSGAEAELMEYNPLTDTLVIVYTNGMIDILTHGKLSASSRALADYSERGRNLQSISFSADGQSFFIAGTPGYLELALDGTLKSYKTLGANLTFANRIGGRMVVATSTGLYTFLEADAPTSLSACTQLRSDAAHSNARLIASDGSLTSPYGIIPAGGNSFIYFGPNTTSASFGISANLVDLNPEAELQSVTTLLSETLDAANMGLVKNIVHKHFYEGLISPMTNGFTLSTPTNFWKVDLSAETPAATRYKKDTSVTTSRGNERYKEHGSADGLTYLIYHPHEGFVRRTVSGEADAAKWSAAEGVITLNAPAAGGAQYLGYHPDYGMLVRNFAWDNHHDQWQYATDGFSGCLHGEWTMYSLIRHNRTYYTKYYGPSRGVAYDPLYPERVYSTHRLGGMIVLDMENPGSVIRLGVSTAANETDANHVSVAENQKGYPGLVCFGVPSFDNSSTLWTTYVREDGTGNRAGELRYWTADARRAFYDSADRRSAYKEHPMGMLEMPGAYTCVSSFPVACRMPGNENIVAVMQDADWVASLFYDHNGTLEDTSDDRWVELANVIDENGDETPYLNANSSMIEDPYDGKFLISTHLGLITTTPSDLFDYEKPHVEWVRPEADEAEGMPVARLGEGGVAGMAVDAEGRKWIATSISGLYCLSADRKTILAHFTTANSTLPSDELLGVAYNPEDATIWVGTHSGISVLHPSGSDVAGAATPVSVSPRMVRPDYQGYVSIDGVADSEPVVILGPDGSEVARLQPVAGRAQWHPTGMPGGIYTVAGHPDCEIHIH